MVREPKGSDDDWGQVMTAALQVQPLSNGLLIVAESYVNTVTDMRQSFKVSMLLAAAVGGVCAALLGPMPGVVALVAGVVYGVSRRVLRGRKLARVERTIADEMIREIMEQGIDGMMAAQVLANWLHDAHKGVQPFKENV